MKLILPAIITICILSVLAFVPIRKINYNTTATEENKEGIKFFPGGYSAALAEAKKQNKLVFVDAYATWCGPCKLLKKNTFPDAKAGKFFNDNFVNVALDIEEGEGPRFATKFRISSIPTLVITDANGYHVATSVGYIGPDKLIKFGEKALKKVSR